MRLAKDFSKRTELFKFSMPWPWDIAWSLFQQYLLWDMSIMFLVSFVLHSKLALFFFFLFVLIFPSKIKSTVVDQDSYGYKCRKSSCFFFLLGHKHIALPIRQCSVDSLGMLKSLHLSFCNCYFPTGL